MKLHGLTKVCIDWQNSVFTGDFDSGQSQEMFDKFSKLVLAACALAAISAGSVQANERSSIWQILRGGEDGNLGVKRSYWSHQPNINCDVARNPYARVSKVSKFALFGNPAAYKGKIVAIIGYISNDGSKKYLIYPTKEAYDLGFSRDALSITFNPVFKGIDEFKDGTLVEAIGEFVPSSQSIIENTVGTLTTGSVRLVNPADAAEGRQ